MNKASKYQSAIIIFFTTACIIASYEFKLLHFSFPGGQALVLLISLLLGNYVGSVLSSFTLNIECFRYALLGNLFIEGCWSVKTYEGKDKIRSEALVIISYNGDLMMPTVTAYEIRPTGLVFSVSKDAFLREGDLSFINYFYSSGADGNILGVAIGNFYMSSKGRSPQRYEGKLFYLSESKSSQLYREIGIKLTKSTVQEYQKTHREKWIEAYLEENGRFEAR